MRQSLRAIIFWPVAGTVVAVWEPRMAARRSTRRVSLLEYVSVQDRRMSRRRPTKAERMRVITIDLLADWRPYAAPLPEPRDEYDWRYFGTITIDAQTGALAWRAGSYGFGSGVGVRELGQWDRIKVNSILLDEPSGCSNAPCFTPLELSVWPEDRC